MGFHGILDDFRGFHGILQGSHYVLTELTIKQWWLMLGWWWFNGNVNDQQNRDFRLDNDGDFLVILHVILEDLTMMESRLYQQTMLI
jgi:hypothetical protein